MTRWSTEIRAFPEVKWGLASVRFQAERVQMSLEFQIFVPGDFVRIDRWEKEQRVNRANSLALSLNETARD